MTANITINPANKYVFGSKVVTIGTEEFVLQDYSLSRPSEVTELNGSSGETICVVAVQKSAEISGTFVKESAKTD